MSAYRAQPTDYQATLCQRLAEKVKEETGLVVDPEVVRAVRWTNLRWPKWALFEDQFEVEREVRRTQLERRRARALSVLNEVEHELRGLSD